MSHVFLLIAVTVILIVILIPSVFIILHFRNKKLKKYLDESLHTRPLRLSNIVDNQKQLKKNKLARKVIRKLIKKDELSGRFDETRDVYIPPSASQAKEEVFSYLRQNVDQGSIDLQNMASEVNIPEEDVVCHIDQLMREKNFDGEIDELRGVFVPINPKGGKEREKAEELKFQQTRRDQFAKEIHSRSDDPPPPPEEDPSSESAVDLSKEEIEKRLKSLKEDEEMLDAVEVEKLLEEGRTKKAGERLKELENKFKHYQEVIQNLNEIDEKLSDLSRKFADGEIGEEAYLSAKEGLETNKYDLNQELNDLRKEVIHEDYEKPF